MEYTVSCKFETVQLGKSKGTVVGSSGRAEVYLTIEEPFDITDTTNPELIQGCVDAIQDNPKVPGRILSLIINKIDQNI